MKNQDGLSTDFKQGNVILDINLTKMANGQFKASANGVEVNHLDQTQAVLQLQDKLQHALWEGELRPE